MSAERLAAQASALGQALKTAGALLDPPSVEQARRVVDKVAARTSIAGGHTVVALAGATGSGKSSLFNALAGAEVAAVGARRPTTSSPTAAWWGDEPAGELLDWLKVSARHRVDGAAGAADPSVGPLDGLVLLDLPDFDSRDLSHRAESERILALCDVFVWVCDPQKYADALLHDEHVRQLSGHDAVTLVVLNQSDRLAPNAARECREDLVRLLQADGLRDVPVLLTSARTGDGLPELRQRVRNAVAGQNAARQRLSADVVAVAGRLRSGVADTEPSVGEGEEERLVDALSRAAGVPIVLDAVERDYRREAAARSGWLFTRWVRAVKPDPLKRLRLDKKPLAEGVTASDVRTVLGRSSIPAPSPSARAAVRLATRDLADQAARGLPARWAEALSEAASPPDAGLTDALDQAVVTTPLRARSPMWWRVMGILQWILGFAVLAGLVWLAVLGVIGWLQLPQVDTPRLGPLPYPFLLLAAGLVLGVLGAGLSRVFGRLGARRRRALVAGRMRDAIGAVAQERIVKPVREVLDRHKTTRERLDTSRSA